MSFAFITFGVLSVNLVTYVAANADYLLTYRWTAIVDGGAQQFAEIWLTAFAALAAYLAFKLCEHALIERFAHDVRPTPQAVSDEASLESDGDPAAH